MKRPLVVCVPGCVEREMYFRWFRGGHSFGGIRADVSMSGGVMISGRDMIAEGGVAIYDEEGAHESSSGDDSSR